MIMTREELQNEFGDAVCVYCNKNIIPEHNYWLPQDRHGAYGFQLPQGSIKKLIGRELSCSDEPVELKEK